MLQGIAARVPASVFSLNTKAGTVINPSQRVLPRSLAHQTVPVSVFRLKTKAGTRAATPWSKKKLHGGI